MAAFPKKKKQQNNPRSKAPLPPQGGGLVDIPKKNVDLGMAEVRKSWLIHGFQLSFLLVLLPRCPSSAPRIPNSAPTQLSQFSRDSRKRIQGKNSQRIGGGAAVKIGFYSLPTLAAPARFPQQRYNPEK